MSKKKYIEGGFLQEYSSPISMAGNLVGTTVEQVAGPTSMGGGIAGGALKGAATGAAFGPWGAAIGGVVGGVAGGLNAKKAQEANTAEKLERKNLADQMFVRNSGNSYKKGGTMKGKLNVVQGGTLNNVSKDAVEVSANNPGMSDSVELDQAFVDDGEIIDKENRVFSDSVMFNGKSVAKQAKKLEKMKSKSSRFQAANSLIDSKLDELYNYQESTKKPALKKGGKISRASGGPLDNLKIFTEGPVEDSLQAMYRKEPTFGAIPATTASGEVAGGGPLYNPNTPQTSEPGFNWSKAGTQLATYGPNLLNGFLQTKLQGPAAPTLETSVKLDRIDPGAQLAGNARQAANAGKVVRNGVAQSSDLMAATGSLLSRRLAADNAVIGQTQGLNAEIQGREAITNQGVRARNAERLTGFNQSKKDFANKKIQNVSEIATNASTKALAQGREKNEIDRDKLALGIIKSQYGDSGVIPRNFEGYLDDYFAKKKGGLKRGGKLSMKKAC